MRVEEGEGEGGTHRKPPVEEQAQEEQGQEEEGRQVKLLRLAKVFTAILDGPRELGSRQATHLYDLNKSEIHVCGCREYGQCGHTADEREVSPATPATDVTTDISAPPSSSDRHQYLGIAVPTLLDVSAALREGGEAARHVQAASQGAQK